MTRRIPSSESLTIEFKSDRAKLSDNELILAIVCLANTDGGVLYLGVEDDGAITGLHPEHRDLTGLAAMIANRTVPQLSTRVEAVEEEGSLVARIEVPRSDRLVATTAGTLQRRRLRHDGRPECIPFLPHEFLSRQADLGAADPSELLIEASSIDDLDPIERERLRQAVAKYRGDRSLLGLDDAELDGALGLTVTRDGRRVPTVTGILLIGREEAIRRHVPVHEVAFQRLDDTEVRVNDFYRWPLVRVFERVEEQFTAHLDETEIQVGLYRVPVPRVEQRAFREALINALTHRDYTRLGAVHVRWNRESLTVSNPGGFVDGVSLDNLLVTEPRPRNRQLADAIKRIGLAERTGRGVDLIYKGLLRYGRPPPDYARTDARNVVVSLSCADADLAFLRLVIREEDRLGAPLPLDTLIALSLLNRQKRAGVHEIAMAVQRDVFAARAVVERLVEVGLVEAHGIKKGRTYTLAPRVYREMGQADEYVRQAGFDRLQQEQMVRTYVREHGSIRRRDVIRLCRLSPQQATRLLARLVEEDVLARHGRGKGSVYEPGVNI